MMAAASAAASRGEDPPPGTDEPDIGPVGTVHGAVLVGAVVQWLRPRPGARLVDATVGLGGHALALLNAAPATTLLGVDRDPEALAIAAGRLAQFGDRVSLREGSFEELPALLTAQGWADGADAVLFDLGVSSLQLDDPARGFSFRAAGPLDMRLGPRGVLTAAEVVNTWDEAALARIIAHYGEEPRARAIARAIVRARPLADTAELARVVAGVAGVGKPGLHPATRTFQALRIVVNDELGALDRVLAEGWRLLRAGGRMAILAYHSLEDRAVKQAFRRWAARCVCPPGLPRCTCGWWPRVAILTPHPVRPDREEVARNPRARSARLRVVERLGDPLP